MPNSAVMIGRPIASTDPNAINRMSTAARMPISSLAGCVWSVNIEPPSSTCSVGGVRLLRRRRACASRDRPARRSPARRTGSRRTRSCRRSRRTAAPPGSYGVMTDATCVCLRNAGASLLLDLVEHRGRLHAAGAVRLEHEVARVARPREVVLHHVEGAAAIRCPAARTTSAGRRPPSSRAR